MALRLACMQCKQVITGTSEDELVANVQDHVAGHRGTLRTSRHAGSAFR